MKKNTLVYLVILTLILVGFIKYVVSGSRIDNDSSMRIELVEAISKYESGESSVIDFSDLFTFDWERVYFFEPYTPPSRIDNILGTFWFRFHHLRIESAESS